MDPSAELVDVDDAEAGAPRGAHPGESSGIMVLHQARFVLFSHSEEFMTPLQLESLLNPNVQGVSDTPSH